jgi:hypothetical protein
MATYRAIKATCEAVVELLKQSWRQDMFTSDTLTFEVYNSDSFTDLTVTVGVTLFLYRVEINPVQRSLPAPPSATGQPRRRQLPVDLHFLLIPWAEEPDEQQEILGWMMRAVEDNPVLPSAFLNANAPGTFADNEVVELVFGQLPNEDLFHIWDSLPVDFHLSVPYVARVVRIDSELDLTGGGPVLTRELDFGDLEGV